MCGMLVRHASHDSHRVLSPTQISPRMRPQAPSRPADTAAATATCRDGALAHAWQPCMHCRHGDRSKRSAAPPMPHRPRVSGISPQDTHHAPLLHHALLASRCARDTRARVPPTHHTARTSQQASQHAYCSQHTGVPSTCHGHTLRQWRECTICVIIEAAPDHACDSPCSCPTMDGRPCSCLARHLPSTTGDRPLLRSASWDEQAWLHGLWLQVEREGGRVLVATAVGDDGTAAARHLLAADATAHAEGRAVLDALEARHAAGHGRHLDAVDDASALAEVPGTIPRLAARHLHMRAAVSAATQTRASQCMCRGQVHHMHVAFCVESKRAAGHRPRETASTNGVARYRYLREPCRQSHAGSDAVTQITDYGSITPRYRVAVLQPHGLLAPWGRRHRSHCRT